MNAEIQAKLADPLVFGKFFWPEVTFYKQQREIIYSVVENDETFVPAGNMLGKDFVSGFIALWFFLSRNPVRVVTTSADYAQLEAVLWGEIRRFIQTSTHPANRSQLGILDSKQGGPLLVNHLHIRKYYPWQTMEVEPLSYLVGRVAAKGEGMLGHHVAEMGDGIARTLWLADEASGVEDISYERASTWARRMLAIGNPYTGAPGCTFFEQGVEKGNIVAA